MHSVLSWGRCEPWLRAASLFVSRGEIVRVAGRRHVPRRGGVLVMATHGGPLDLSVLAAAVPRRLRVVAHAGNADLPVLGACLRLRGMFPVSDAAIGVDEATVRGLKRAAAALRAGEAVAVYPQGVTDEVRAGAVWLAARAGVPVLPVRTYRVWRKGCVPRTLVRIDRPVAPPARDGRARRRFRSRLQQRFGRTGAGRGDRDVRAVLDAALDDGALWRRPAEVVRLAARVHALPPARRRRLAARARHLLSLRRPRVLAAFLAAPAAAGWALCAPVCAWTAWATRKAPHNRRGGRVNLGAALAAPWALALFALHPALPFVAGAGLVALGAWKRARFRRPDPRRRRFAAALRHDGERQPQHVDLAAGQRVARGGRERDRTAGHLEHV